MTFAENPVCDWGRVLFVVRQELLKAQHKSQDGALQMSYFSENLLHDRLSHIAEAYNLGATSGIPAHIRQEFYIILLCYSLELHTFAQNTKECSFIKVLPGAIASIQWHFGTYSKGLVVFSVFSNFYIIQI